MKHRILALVVAASAVLVGADVRAQSQPQSVKERMARKRAAYARHNQQARDEAMARQMMAEMESMRRVEAYKAAVDASAGRPREKRTPMSAVQEGRAPKIGGPTFRPDQSGPRGIPNMVMGTPTTMPYSKNWKTGEVIPSAMIPKGYERFYVGVDPR